MDDRAKFKAAYDAWVRSRQEFDGWMRQVVDGKMPADKSEGYRLAEACQESLLACTA